MGYCKECKGKGKFEPCNHPGCYNHVSHPCEGCGRYQGKCLACNGTEKTKIRYIEISRYEQVEKKIHLAVGDKTVYKKDVLLGFYIQPYDNLMQAIDSEFDDVEENKDSYLKLKIIEMTEKEYNKLSEFTGY